MFKPDRHELLHAYPVETHKHRHLLDVEPKERTMTTTVKVHVNGQYRATVKQDALDPVTVEGNYHGGSGEKSFYLPHPAKATFEISEEYVKDDDKRPAE